MLPLYVVFLHNNLAYQPYARSPNTFRHKLQLNGTFLKFVFQLEIFETETLIAEITVAIKLLL